MSPRERIVSVVGLGYVGLPVAAAFARAGLRVVGFDVAPDRVAELRSGHDRTGELARGELDGNRVSFTTDPADLAAADFHVVTVPTPVDDARRPDLSALLAASRTVGRALGRGDVVVYESTVYPGCTEEVCGPVLERESGLACGRDFFLGYSPERINPGDRVHRLESVTKVVAGQDAATLDLVAEMYGRIVSAGVHRAPDIRTAEAAKVIENTQRDLNIALMNELALIFQRLGIDTRDVLAAARTKWNFLPFEPGLVGGHCIGVDPYYLTHRAEQAGYIPEVILAGRRINDGMGAFVAQETLRRLLRRGGDLSATVLGVTFKEGVPDVRNSRTLDIVRELASFGVRVQVHDPLADPAHARDELGLDLVAADRLQPAGAVVVAVAHGEYRAGGWPLVRSLLRGGAGVAMDVKGVLDRTAVPDGIELWRL